MKEEGKAQVDVTSTSYWWIKLWTFISNIIKGLLNGVKGCPARCELDRQPLTNCNLINIIKLQDKNNVNLNFGTFFPG